NLEEKQLEEEQAFKAQSWKFPVFYDDDDDKEGYNSLNDNIISELPPYSAVTPTEPVDSLIMGDEHLNTIPATESDEVIKSCIENHVPNLSEPEGENGCDVPVQKKQEEKRIEEEQAAKAQNRKLPVCYDDDDDEEESNYLKDNIISELPPCFAVTPSEPVDSLSMGDEHLDTIPAT
nr:hypothetical protein [Tanacetum cinerariifolium]